MSTGPDVERHGGRVAATAGGSKLGVSNRAEAAGMAHMLGL